MAIPVNLAVLHKFYASALCVPHHHQLEYNIHFFSGFDDVSQENMDDKQKQTQEAEMLARRVSHRQLLSSLRESVEAISSGGSFTELDTLLQNDASTNSKTVIG